MKISIIGPHSPIPPIGWGAVETLIWDMKLSLDELGHEVQIVNIGDPQEIIRRVNSFSPDFVHINYDDWVFLYPAGHACRPGACVRPCHLMLWGGVHTGRGNASSRLNPGAGRPGVAALRGLS